MYEDHSGEFVCGYCGLNDLCFYFLDEIKCSFSKANENPDDIYLFIYFLLTGSCPLERYGSSTMMDLRWLFSPLLQVSNIQTAVAQ